MGIQLTVTANVSATLAQLTLPRTNLTLIGVAVQKATIGGYIQIPTSSGRFAVLPWNVSRGVTTTDVAVITPPGGDHYIKVHKSLTEGTLNYLTVGLTSGVIFFYFGTPFPGSVPLEQFNGVAQSVTTSSPSAFSFPAGNLVLTGILYEPGYSTTETNVNTDFSWSTGQGISVDVNFGTNEPLSVVPLDNLPVASSLSVTAAFDGTHVATGQLILYYK